MTNPSPIPAVPEIIQPAGDPPYYHSLCWGAVLAGTVAAIGIGGALFLALRPQHQTAGSELYNTSNRTTPDGIDSALERVESDVLLQERLRQKLLDLNILGPPKTWSPR